MVEHLPLLINTTMTLMLVVGICLTLTGLPGNLLIVVVSLAYGWQEGFLSLTSGSLLVLVGLYLSGEVIEFLAGSIGAKKEQASGKTIAAAFFGAIVGGIMGTGILPVIGTLVGSVTGGFFASYSVEYKYAKDKRRAIQVAKGVVRGQLLGILVKCIVAISMSGIVIYKLWF